MNALDRYSVLCIFQDLYVRYRTNIVSCTTPNPNLSKEQVKQEIDRLTHLQKQSLELAGLVGMTANGWRDYEERRKHISKLTGQLTSLEKPQSQ